MKSESDTSSINTHINTQKSFLSKLEYFARYGANIRKPRLMIRQVKNVIKANAGVKPLLRFAIIVPTFTCNLHCQYCFTEKMKRPEPMMPLTDWKAIAKQSMDLGSIHFNIQGGETLLMGEKLIELIRLLSPWENSISITTNGTIHDRNFLTRLYNEGVDIINCSLDSSDAAKHNQQRGKNGSFEEVLETLKIAYEIGMRVSICSVITRETIRSKGLTELLKITRNYHASMHPNFVVPQGRYHAQFDKLLKADEIEWMKNFINSNTDVSRDLDYNYHHGYGCPAVKETVYITGYGDVIPCPFIQVSLGNLRQEKLTDIVDRGLKIPYFRDYNPGCLASENHEFIKTVMEKICAEDKTPVPFNKVFPNVK